MWNLLHGFSSTRDKTKRKFYDVFNSMNKRCNNPKNDSFPNYWWRGIKCEWKTLNAFIEDMRASYLDHIQQYGHKNTTIDRIDVNWNYCKENCRWATYLEQWSNTRAANNAIVDWIEYTARYIADLCWITIWDANHRICRYNMWKMDKNKLLHIGYLKWSKRVKEHGNV